MHELHRLQQSSRNSLDEHRRSLDEFSVALFGRTMAGKSTLMEILTNGSGATIGQGAQRTTRDVRTYSWKGLRVTDVPGVAAFEGSEDEELAFQAAAKADLILFLITDDAPQPVEAECLAQVRALGKPVIGICNVKAALEDADDIDLFLRAPEKRFNMGRLESLVGPNGPKLHIWTSEGTRGAQTGDFVTRPAAGS
ncbi:MAG: 50S ribosome-binding GTPase, partial [Albidovulum sp.]|nr:50S ribosome-binding GTPase [Albidovulum sp.]